MAQYARNTTVSIEKSRMEIEQTLRRYGAQRFSFTEATDIGVARIEFQANERHVRFELTLPQESDPEFRKTKQGRARSQNSRRDAWDQACRQRWRALSLCVKAKLESVECGIASFDEEFLAHIVIPDASGKATTVSKLMLPQVQESYATGKPPSGLLALGYENGD